LILTEPSQRLPELSHARSEVFTRFCSASEVALTSHRFKAQRGIMGARRSKIGNRAPDLVSSALERQGIRARDRVLDILEELGRLLNEKLSDALQQRAIAFEGVQCRVQVRYGCLWHDA
jgi:hypothetical protein